MLKVYEGECGCIITLEGTDKFTCVKGCGGVDSKNAPIMCLDFVVSVRCRLDEEKAANN